MTRAPARSIVTQPCNLQLQDPNANRALWHITLVRMRRHRPTKDYVTQRTAEGKTKAEIMRCLKRYIARGIYPGLPGIDQDRVTGTR
ncbi:hypothetical protein [Micromonospora costi]|uniref:hypothetical protein n=1 Tax=Micromonospora costi TaxID=1530042 RepID=UPI0016525293|nr:hypothetical protein [Micromonospora costi]